MSQPVITQAPAHAQNGRLLSAPGRADETRTTQPLAIMTRGLVKSYGHFQALLGIGLDVYRGEVHEVVQAPVLLAIAERELNRMITNDKFCCTRWADLQPSWWRRPLRLRS